MAWLNEADFERYRQQDQDIRSQAYHIKALESRLEDCSLFLAAAMSLGFVSTNQEEAMMVAFQRSIGEPDKAIARAILCALPNALRLRGWK
ncbi:MAG: hypothetical protein ACYDBO_02160 [Vulcanimicrobiaceae bacterium]